MCVGQWIGEGKAGIQMMSAVLVISLPFPLFLVVAEMCSAHVPVLGIPMSVMIGCRSSPCSGKHEQQSGGEGS